MKKLLPSVTVEYDSNDQVVISDDESLVWGIGDTFLEAMEDYSISYLEWRWLSGVAAKWEVVEDTLDAVCGVKALKEYGDSG